MTLLVRRDRVEEIVQNAGLTDFDLAGPVDASYMAFAAADVDGAYVPYCARHRSSGQWETGVGLYDESTNTLARVDSFRNSNGAQTKIDFAVGIVDVWIDITADKSVMLDADSDDLTLPGGLTIPDDLLVDGSLDVGGSAILHSGVTVIGPTTLGGIIYTWPGSQAPNRYLKTNGSGVLTWASILESISLGDLSDVTLTSPTTGQALIKSAGDWINTNDGTALNVSASNLTTGTVPSARVAGSYTGITGLGTVTVGTWSASTVAVTVGGTGLTGYAIGDLIYASGTTTLAKLPTGTAAQYLRVNAGATAPEWHTLTPGDITSPAALTRTDDTNITLTLGGSPTTALLAATSVTVGWTGTLAAARLNANVVQGVTNDTNVTGVVSAQNLTLGWTGTLSTARGGSGFGSYAIGDMLYANGTTTLAKLTIGAANTVLTSSGTAPQWSTSLSLAGTLTVAGLATLQASAAVTGGITYTTSLTSTTGLATPSALVATTRHSFASTVSGAVLMGFGTTYDVALKNRAGTDVVGIQANTLLVDLAGQVGIGTAALANRALTIGGSMNATGGFARGISMGGITLIAGANGDALTTISAGQTPSFGSFTGLILRQILLGTLNTSTATSPAEVAQVQFGTTTGKAGADASGLIFGAVSGGDTNYLMRAATAATFNVLASGALTSASTITTGNSVVFSGATSASAGSIGLNSTNGVLLVGKTGATYDFAITNNAGAIYLAGTTATQGVVMPGTLTVTNYMVGGGVQATGGSHLSTGQSLELGYGIFAGTTGHVIAFDRTGAAYLPLMLAGSTITIGTGTQPATFSNSVTVTTTLGTGGDITITKASGNTVIFRLSQTSVVDWTMFNTATTGVLGISDGGTTWVTIAKTTGVTTMVGATSFSAGLIINGQPTVVAGAIYKSATAGLAITGIAGSSFDFSLLNPTFSQFIITVPTGTLDVVFGGGVKIGAGAVLQLGSTRSAGVAVQGGTITMKDAAGTVVTVLTT